MRRNAECATCGVTAADLPFEELGLDLEDASETLFERVDGVTYCGGCAGGITVIARQQAGPDSWQWLGTDR